MENKTVSKWWIVTMVILVVAAVFDDGTPEGNAELYTLAGLGMVIFGSIAAYKLHKLDK